MRGASCSEDEGDDPPYVTRSGARELALLGNLGRGSELALVQRTAEQQAQITAASERIESLESQRRWLWGGIGVSALVLAILVMRRRPAPEKQRGSSPERQAA